MRVSEKIVLHIKNTKKIVRESLTKVLLDAIAEFGGRILHNAT